MKYVVLFFICCTSLANSQEKYWTRSGTLTFEASMPAFEEVKATNENVTAILNTTDGTFAALALVKGFRFKNALMEEHFNESYIESNRYPKAIFKGQLLNFDVRNEWLGDDIRVCFREEGMDPDHSSVMREHDLNHWDRIGTELYPEFCFE